MIVTCKRQTLQNAVLNVSRAVSSKSSIPALEGILFKAKNGQIFLCGYDLEIGITTSIDADVIEEGDVIFGSKLFGDIIRSLPNDEVTIKVDSKYTAHIISGSSEFHIIGIAASEYPDLPSVSGGSSLHMPQNVLKSMIRQTLFAVAVTNTKPVHTGTLFQLKDGCLRLVSVDGCRLAMRTEFAAYQSEAEFVVPGKTLSEVLKLIGDDTDTPVAIGIGRRHIVFTVENSENSRYSVISRLLDGEFLKYEQTIPNNCVTDITVSTRRFIQAVERMSLVVNERMKSPVTCTITDMDMKFSCETAIGCATDSFEIKNEGESLEIGYSDRYMLDALRATESDEVRIQISGPVSPIKILPKEGDSFLFLVLPVRLKSKS